MSTARLDELRLNTALLKISKEVERQHIEAVRKG